MDPFTLGVTIAAFVGPIVVALVALSLRKLVDWFKARRTISPQAKNKIGVIIAERLNNRDFVEIPGVFDSAATETRLVQAVYDMDTDTVLDARAIRSVRQAAAQLSDFICEIYDER